MVDELLGKTMHLDTSTPPKPNSKLRTLPLSPITPVRRVEQVSVPSKPTMAKPQTKPTKNPPVPQPQMQTVHPPPSDLSKILSSQNLLTPAQAQLSAQLLAHSKKEHSRKRKH